MLYKWFSYVAPIVFLVNELRILNCDLSSLPQFVNYQSLAVMWNLIPMDPFQPDFQNQQTNGMTLSYLYRRDMSFDVDVKTTHCNETTIIFIFLGFATYYRKQIWLFGVLLLPKSCTVSYVLISDLQQLLGGIEMGCPHWGITRSFQTSHCCLSTQMCPDFWPVGPSTVPDPCAGFTFPARKLCAHYKMNCRLVTFDAFKCLLHFKQKLKPRTEFRGEFLNKKDCMSLVCKLFYNKTTK